MKIPINTLLNTKHVAMKNISKLELVSLSSEDKIPVDNYLQKTFDLDDVTIDHLKGGLFQKLTYDSIRIKGSQIFMIDSTAFNGIQVNKLELINNNITTIANRSFSNITINTFDVKQTNIEKIKSGAFVNIKIKKKINLFDIKIGSISKRALNIIRAKSFEMKDVEIKETEVEAFTNIEIENYGGSWKVTEEGIEISNITIDNLEPGLFQNSNYETVSIKNSNIGVIDSNTFNNAVIDNLELVNTDIGIISNGSFNSIQTKRSQSFTSLIADLCLDRKKQVLHLADALMEHLLEGIAPLRLWQVSSEEKICTCYSSDLD